MPAENDGSIDTGRVTDSCTLSSNIVVELQLVKVDNSANECKCRSRTEMATKRKKCRLQL